MNKNYLLAIVAIFASATTLFAQPTLTSATNDPIPGDQFYGYFVDTNGLSIGPSGASVTWNYASLVRNDTDTTLFLSCASTPYCDSFPTSNIVMLTGTTDYGFGTKSTSGIEVHGFYSAGDIVRFTNKMTYSRFPLTYGTTYNDTFALTINFMGFDVAVVTRTTNTADAWGTLTLPSGTFSNVIRVHTTSITSQSVSGFPSSEQQTETYNWYVSGFHMPLLTMNLDTAGATSLYLSDAKYTVAAPTVSVKNIDKQVGMNIFPNPAADETRIRFEAQSTGNATAVVTDVAGKVVYTTDLNVKFGTNEAIIPVSTLPNGIYLVRVQGANVMANGRFSVMK